MVITGLEYLRSLPAKELSKVLIRSCPSDVGLKNLEHCPKLDCVNCWTHALESEVDWIAAAKFLKQEYF